MRRRQLLQKDVLAGKCAYHRDAQPVVNRTGQSGEHHVGEVNHIGANLAVQPLKQLFQFLALPAVFAAQHRDRHVAPVLGPDTHAAAGCPIEQPRPVEKAIEKPGRVPEYGRVLLQIDVDAAESDAIDGDVFFVGPQRRVERGQQHVAARGAGPRPGCCRAGNCRNTCVQRRRQGERFSWGRR